MIRGASAILLYDKNKKILIQHRTSDAPTSPNHWGFFGGGIEEGETPLKTVKRETFEELDIKIRKPKLIFKEYINEEGKEHWIYYYVKKVRKKSKIKLKEGQNMMWIFPNEIDGLLAKPHVKRMIKFIGDKL